MTPEQWLSKHYPIPASELAEASDEECLLHCENKWQGAKEENLPEGMKYAAHIVFYGHGYGIKFDYETCALCHKYGYETGSCEKEDGMQCPIVRMRGYPCHRVDYGDREIYEKSENDPAPMIDLLKRTLEFVRAGG